jgi:hypothetical protein
MTTSVRTVFTVPSAQFDVSVILYNIMIHNIEKPEWIPTQGM